MLGACTTVLLPARRRFQGQAVSPRLAKRLGQGTIRSAPIAAGESLETAQIQRYFIALPKRSDWPAAALSRVSDCSDAHDGQWMRADPGFVQVDMGVVRLMSVGDMPIDVPQAEAFVHSLKPVFGDAGFELSMGAANRWYLRAMHNAPLPNMPMPDQALGADIFHSLPANPLGKRWRNILNDVQIILHNHPQNAIRLANGLWPINTVYFYGAGGLPDSLTSPCRSIHSQDSVLLGAAKAAGLEINATVSQQHLLDCRDIRDWAVIEGHLARFFSKPIDRTARIVLDFTDGMCIELTHKQALRFWRRPLLMLA